MKIQYCSDLHLEFPENREFIMKHPLKPVGDILILAGDIVPFSLMDVHSDFFDYIEEYFKTTYWIPGNHEYYNSDIRERSGFIQEKIRTNVSLVNNTSLVIENVRFIFSTLWTRITPAHQSEIRQRLSDFHAIKKGGRRFSPDDYNHQHEQALTFLKNELATLNDQKRVVITHHVPTLMNYPEKYRRDSLNEAFAVELRQFIEAYGADCWIFGHHHSIVNDFTIGKTRMLSNQLGYVRYNEHIRFDPLKSIHV